MPFAMEMQTIVAEEHSISSVMILPHPGLELAENSLRGRIG